MSTSCPAPFCTATTRGVQELMCRNHWFRVPKALRDQVWRTWRAFIDARSLETIEEYMAARQAAIVSVSPGGGPEPFDGDPPEDVGKDFECTVGQRA